MWPFHGCIYLCSVSAQRCAGYGLLLPGTCLHVDTQPCIHTLHTVQHRWLAYCLGNPPLLLCSVWTVDLAHLLCLCGLKVTLTTTVLGPNPAYASDAFYMENLAEDAGRVKHLFEVNDVSPPAETGSKRSWFRWGGALTVPSRCFTTAGQSWAGQPAAGPGCFRMMVAGWQASLCSEQGGSWWGLSRPLPILTDPQKPGLAQCHMAGADLCSPQGGAYCVAVQALLFT